LKSLVKTVSLPVIAFALIASFTYA